ncbi:leucyl/phenylalanyl-tRNA--protein transferase [Aestuariibius sp. HNIBRBA575]|uniref:leucyl/phenylalanyl-tRNA--protein transferase n=1 Tax=Aestuariibius sp. HNIBRBA575 TaxID=3233343 RepID=UPI0034A5B2C4
MNAPLTPELLLHAYASGIFPMSEGKDDPEVFWVDPKRRGILPLDGFHISRSLAKRIQRGGFDVTLNQDFTGCVQACANRPETWINDTIFSLYTALHIAGFAHSIEVWQGKNMVGGVYGVALGSVFFGESMFSTQTDMSKVALAYLTCHLTNSGFTLFDTQFITDHLKSLGGIEISRAEYRRRLAQAIESEAQFQGVSPLPSAQDVVQRSTQTS